MMSTAVSPGYHWSRGTGWTCWLTVQSKRKWAPGTAFMAWAMLAQYRAQSPCWDGSLPRSLWGSLLSLASAPNRITESPRPSRTRLVASWVAYWSYWPAAPRARQLDGASSGTMDWVMMIRLPGTACFHANQFVSGCWGLAHHTLVQS